jgi:hypothetical protein
MSTEISSTRKQAARFPDPGKTAAWRRAAFRAGTALLLAICVFISFKSVMNSLGLDEDTAHSLMLWYGIKDWGLQGVQNFNFTADNWLLSVVPLHFLLFFLFGPRPELVVLSGWLGYALSAMLSALLAWELQAKRAALGIAVVLLCLGSYALGWGFAAYAFSHNISNTYGLFAVLLTVKWFRQPKIIYPFLILGCLTIAAVSDPWTLIAYALPLLVSAVLGAVWPIFGIRRNLLIKLAATVSASIVLSQTKLFGLFRFIPSQPAQRASLALMRHNLLYLIRDLGGLLNLVPGQTANAPVPAIFSLLVITAAICVIFSKAFRICWQHPSCRFFITFAILSIALTAAAFVALDIVAAAFSGRFLMNVLYFIVIGFAITADLGWQKYGPKRRGLVVFVSALFLIASLDGTYPFWSSNRFVVRNYFGVTQLVTFLKQNDLTYGYGPFHGSHSNAVTATSQNTVKLRPALFDPLTGMIMPAPRAETYDQWMTPKDFPAGSTRFFVLVTSDGEQCPDLQRCETGLVRQFGTPEQILQYSPTIWIYVWPRKSQQKLFSTAANAPF